MRFPRLPSTLFSTLLATNLAAAAVLPATLHLSSPSPTATTTTTSSTPLPLIIWHGLGDSFDGAGLTQVAELAATTNPGTQVYLIRISNTSSLDRRATFFGNMTEQLAIVCDAIRTHPVLSTASAVNALGFSQGGPFLRGYIERCNDPPVHNFVTFGSPHNGIARFSKCAPSDWLCLSFQALLAANTWSTISQSSLIPAQYYRNLDDFSNYLNHSNYLADINNERPHKNPTYKKNIASLSKFVMIGFEQDTTVVPRQSSWFADVNGTSGVVTPLRNRTLYKEDWLGLRELDEKGGLVFEMLPGKHMEIGEGALKRVMKEYFGPVKGVVVYGKEEMEEWELVEEEEEEEGVLQRLDLSWIDL